MVVVAGEVARPSRAAVLAAAFDESPTLLDQAVAALRAWPVPADLALAGVDDPADLPVGLADRALLSAYEQITGLALEHTVACDYCAELTTLPLGRTDVGEHHPCSAWTGPGCGVREPTWSDLQAAGDEPDVLLHLCCVGAGGTIEDLARIEGSLSGPLHTVCSGCGTDLEVDVNVVTLVLTALGSMAADLDHDVHVLASRYGWDLAVIEALSDDRRRRLSSFARSAP